MRAHYPSEHDFDNNKHDLEIQLFHNATPGMTLGCRSNIAAISIFFDLNVTTDETHDFFNFTT